MNEIKFGIIKNTAVSSSASGITNFGYYTTITLPEYTGDVLASWIMAYGNDSTESGAVQSAGTILLSVTRSGNKIIGATIASVSYQTCHFVVGYIYK